MVRYTNPSCNTDIMHRLQPSGFKAARHITTHGGFPAKFTRDDILSLCIQERMAGDATNTCKNISSMVGYPYRSATRLDVKPHFTTTYGRMAAVERHGTAGIYRMSINAAAKPSTPHDDITVTKKAAATLPPHMMMPVWGAPPDVSRCI